jgi:hypothetical protein
MAKKSRPSGKPESEVSAKEESVTSGEDKGRIDFFYLFTGAGILTGIMYITYGILHYVFHIL